MLNHSVLNQRISATKDKSDDEEFEFTGSGSSVNQAADAIDGVETPSEEESNRDSAVNSLNFHLPRCLNHEAARQ